jgi:glutamyl-tRNA synthetase
MEDVWDGITHVIRGEDHVSNTPKQINIIRSVGAELPAYAHVPNVLGSDGKKLSKRHGATGVDELRAQGYYAPALMNFLALLGWAPDGETTIMSREELIERFSLERVSPSPAQFDYDKLDWMNGVYLRALPVEEYASVLLDHLREQGYEWDEARVRAAAPLVQEKIQRLGEFPAFAGFLFHDVAPEAAELNGGSPMLEAATAALASLEPFTAESIEAALRAAGVPARTGRGHRLENLARALREHRAARPGRDARPAQGGGRRRIGSGRGRASGSRARWNSSHARRRYRVVGVGSPRIRSSSRSTSF